jgi:hypothetical protein
LAGAVKLPARCALALSTALLFAPAAFGQDPNAAIEQSRLFQNTVSPTEQRVNANGIELPDADSSQSGDDSFGAQQVLKAHEKTRDFLVGGDASVFYTSNVALTHRDTISDTFFVADASLTWTHRIDNQFQLQAGARASIFRYNDTSVLDFQSVGGGLGAVWTPQNAWGLAMVARYDFVELIDRHSDELLQDHEFSLALQKIFVLGRYHALSVAVIGSAGISDPFAEQRDQIGFSIGYHLQLTRNLDTEIGYRHAWYFYNSGNRTDLNQVLSLGLHYHFNRWASLDGFISGATNYSDNSAFKYDVFTTGGGVGVTIRF